MSYISLQDLSTKVHNEEIQLPDFQRPFVWDEQKQRSMIASYLIGVPLGSLLLFRGRRDEYNSLAIGTIGKSLPMSPPEEVVEYLLDGQQRITTLMSVFSDWFEGKSSLEIKEMLKQKNRKPQALFSVLHKRWFIDLNKDMQWINLFGLQKLEVDLKRFDSDGEAETLERTKVIRAKSISNGTKDEPYHPERYLNHPEELIEYCIERRLIPLFKLSDQLTMGKILAGIQQERAAELGLTDEPEWAAVIEDHLLDWLNSDSFLLEKVPLRRISRGFYSFSKRNYSGMSLKVFDLLTAKSAIAFYGQYDHTQGLKSCRLEDRVCEALLADEKAYLKSTDATLESLKLTENDRKHLTAKMKSFFSQLISVYSVHQKGKLPIKPDHAKTGGIIAHIRPEDVSGHFETVTTALVKAARFCYQRLGITHISALPYSPMFLPIAYVYAVRGMLSDAEMNRVEAWYWMTLFSGEYGKDSSSAAAKDCNELLALVQDNTMGVRFSERLRQVKHHELPGFYVGPLAMSGNPFDNSSSIAQAISSFVFSQSALDPSSALPSAAHFKPALLLNGPATQNIFEHPLNASCQGSVFDADAVGLDLSDPAEVIKAYQSRAQRLTAMIRGKLEVLTNLRAA